MTRLNPPQDRKTDLPIRVLIAEDNKDLAEIFARFLEHAGYRVKTAANGEEALLLLEIEKPHLVVLDLNMPFATGLDVLQYIRLQRSLSATKVMIVTGNRDMLNTIEAKGADVSLLKPITLTELVSQAQGLTSQ